MREPHVPSTSKGRASRTPLRDVSRRSPMSASLPGILLGPRRGAMGETLGAPETLRPRNASEKLTFWAVGMWSLSTPRSNWEGRGALGSPSLLHGSFPWRRDPVHDRGCHDAVRSTGLLRISWRPARPKSCRMPLAHPGRQAVPQWFQPLAPCLAARPSRLPPTMASSKP